MEAYLDEYVQELAQARSLRRLQNEMQMLLYRHPVNDARAAQRRLTVNSFWISGTGTLPSGAVDKSDTMSVQHSLEAAALRDVLIDQFALVVRATMKGSVVMAKIAGTESTANTRSARLMTTSARNNGVAARTILPVLSSCTFTKNFSS